MFQAVKLIDAAFCALGCLAIGIPFALIGGLSVLEGWVSGKARHSIVILLVVVMLLGAIVPASADSKIKPPYLPDPIGATGLFAEQCDWVFYASLEHPFDDTKPIFLDVHLLMSMEYEPGAWEGYESAVPFGREFTHDDMVAIIWTVTPCGADKYTRVYQNSDGSYTVIAFLDVETTDQNDRPCVYTGPPNLNHCGLHHGVFGFITEAEWVRISGQPIINNRPQG